MKNNIINIDSVINKKLFRFLFLFFEKDEKMLIGPRIALGTMCNHKAWIFDVSKKTSKAIVSMKIRMFIAMAKAVCVKITLKIDTAKRDKNKIE